MRQRVSVLAAAGRRVTVTRKGIKNMYLRLDPAQGLRVSAPLFASDAQIRAFVESRLDWIKKAEKKAAGRSGRGAAPQRAYSKEELNAFRQRCRAAFDRWEPLVGRRASRVTLRSMKTRWGSCNAANGHVSINLRLIDMPDECLDYVVVHELCHLWEPNHGKAFWARVAAAYPDYARVRKSMR
ncbi:MAG: M48 family metallopeptidase [Clostridia bacterium]|nr:M48 family metallopeptidase [Clostridia bacterium]